MDVESGAVGCRLVACGKADARRIRKGWLLELMWAVRSVGGEMEYI